MRRATNGRVASGIEDALVIVAPANAIPLIGTLADDARKAVGRARESGHLDGTALEVLEALVDVSTARHA